MYTYLLGSNQNIFCPYVSTWDLFIMLESSDENATTPAIRELSVIQAAD